MSGSSGLGGIHIPATNTLFFRISDLRSKGEDNREENKMAGSGAAAGESSFREIGGVEEEEAIVGGLLVIIGLEDSSIEA